MYDAARQVRSVPWWAVLQLGVAATALGAVLVLGQERGLASAGLARSVGALYVLVGVALLLSLVSNRRRWGYKLVGAAVGIGAAALVVPDSLVVARLEPGTAVLLLGVQGVILGLVILVMGAEDRCWAQVVLGLLCVLVGVASLLNRWLAPVPVALYLGWACIGCGVVASLLSLRSR